MLHSSETPLDAFFAPRMMTSALKIECSRPTCKSTVYGADKVWRVSSRREAWHAAWSSDYEHRLQGAWHRWDGRPGASIHRRSSPLDCINRQFKAVCPDQLQVSSFTYVSTWQGWLYVAFLPAVCEHHAETADLHTACEGRLSNLALASLLFKWHWHVESERNRYIDKIIRSVFCQTNTSYRREK